MRSETAMIAAILGGTVLALALALLGVADLRRVAGQRRQAVDAVIADEVYRAPALERLDRRFRSTAWGRRLDRELVVAGVRYRPLTVVAAGATAAVGSAVLLWALLSPVFAALGGVVGVLGVRGYLRRERARRREAFIGQMPELARVLANATHAGLSIPTAVALAADELDEPASEEMKRVSTQLGFGAPIESALAELGDRLPSREVAVLVATLVVSARAGGSLVTALRDIAETLDERKETRREIRTTLAQSVATGYVVVGLGLLILVGLNLMMPGTVDRMTRTPIGQVALLIAGGLYLVGLLVVRRMTRIEP